jgi:hypothetical protein
MVDVIDAMNTLNDILQKIIDELNNNSDKNNNYIDPFGNDDDLHFYKGMVGESDNKGSNRNKGNLQSKWF